MERRGLVEKAAKGPLATFANRDRHIQSDQSRDETTLMDLGVFLTRPKDILQGATPVALDYDYDCDDLDSYL